MWRFNAPRKEWELFDEEQVGKQINASVFMLINEVELSIYRLLASGAKMPKSSLNPSSKVLTGWLIVGQ